MHSNQARFNMIEQQIRPWHVLKFGRCWGCCPPSSVKTSYPPRTSGLAFADLEIPLMGSGEEALTKGQCMLPPRLDARMLQDLAVQPHRHRAGNRRWLRVTWRPCWPASRTPACSSPLKSMPDLAAHGAHQS